MKKICLKKMLAPVALAAAGSMILGGCGGSEQAPADPGKTSVAALSSESAPDADKISIVVTNFAEYDFVRQIAGDRADLTMLLKPGAESHSYEPTPADIIKIQDSDLFVYVGGDSDEWVEEVLESMDTSGIKLFRLMDAVELYEEETVEGMEEEEHSHSEEEAGEEDHDHDKALSEQLDSHSHSHSEDEPEMDEHVWTSPKNAMTIVSDLNKTIDGLDAANKDFYDANTEAYLKKLADLDQEFKTVVDSAKRSEIIVADRFPFRYFVEEYGLSYYAAFPGCSSDTQPSAQTVAFLTDKVRDNNIPVVFHIELSNEQMADSICADTGAKKELLNAVHNISAEDFQAGVTYIDLMEHNVEVLREALS